MSKFRKMPIVVEAIKLEHYEDDYPGRCDCTNTDVVREGVSHLHTPEGVIAPEVGDWIVTSSTGVIYPCKPDIFESIYEPVERDGGEEEYPVKVIIWRNGMVMSFDADGQQIPDWQGKYEDLKDKIDKLPDSVKVEHM